MMNGARCERERRPWRRRGGRRAPASNRSSGHSLRFARGLMFVASSAFGHGPVPAPLSVLAVDSDGNPSAYALSIGLGRVVGTSVRYGCPTEWLEGQEAYDRPIPVAAVVTGAIVVAGLPHLMRSTDEGCSFEPVGGELLGRGSQVMDVVVASSTTALVVVDEGLEGSTLWALDATGAPRLVDVSAAGFQSARGSAVAAFEFAVAGVDRSNDARAIVVGRGRADQADGLVLRRFESAVLPPGGTSVSSVRVRRVDEAGVWLVVGTADGFHLWHVRDDDTVVEIAQSTGAVHGPAQVCGALAYTVDGALSFVDGPPPCDVSGFDAEIRCLEQRGATTFACANFGMLSLGVVDGQLDVTQHFRMRNLGQPDFSCLADQEARDRCEAVWTHFGAESGLIEPVPEPGSLEPEPEPEVGPNCVCVTRSNTSTDTAVVSMLGVLVLVCRRRRANGRRH